MRAISFLFGCKPRFGTLKAYDLAALWAKMWIIRFLEADYAVKDLLNLLFLNDTRQCSDLGFTIFVEERVKFLWIYLQWWFG
jgi:hypothetical protein